MNKKEVVGKIVKVLQKYNFGGKVILFGTEGNTDSIKLGLEIEQAQGGVLAGLKMYDEVKSLFPNREVQVTSLQALKNLGTGSSHSELKEEISNGVVIYESSTKV